MADIKYYRCVKCHNSDNIKSRRNAILEHYNSISNHWKYKHKGEIRESNDIEILNGKNENIGYVKVKNGNGKIAKEIKYYNCIPFIKKINTEIFSIWYVENFPESIVSYIKRTITINEEEQVLSYYISDYSRKEGYFLNPFGKYINDPGMNKFRDIIYFISRRIITLLNKEFQLSYAKCKNYAICELLIRQYSEKYGFSNEESFNTLRSRFQEMNDYIFYDYEEYDNKIKSSIVAYCKKRKKEIFKMEDRILIRDMQYVDKEIRFTRENGDYDAFTIDSKKKQKAFLSHNYERIKLEFGTYKRSEQYMYDKDILERYAEIYESCNNDTDDTSTKEWIPEDNFNVGYSDLSEKGKRYRLSVVGYHFYGIYINDPQTDNKKMGIGSKEIINYMKTKVFIMFGKRLFDEEKIPIEIYNSNKAYIDKLKYESPHFFPEKFFEDEDVYYNNYYEDLDPEYKYTEFEKYKLDTVKPIFFIASAKPTTPIQN